MVTIGREIFVWNSVDNCWQQSRRRFLASFGVKFDIMRGKDILRLFCFLIMLFGPTCAFMETTMPNEYMICKSVSGVFGTLNDRKNNSEGLLPVLQGPEGAAGPPGKTGLPGPRGEPDYAKVSTIVGDKMNSVNARLYKLEQELDKLKSSGVQISTGPGAPPATKSPDDVKYEKDCLDKFNSPIHYGPICYNIIGGEGLLWTFEAAESNCTKLGGFLADLNSRELYDLIYEYIDKTYSTVVKAWTGMRYENNKLLLREEGEATYAKWSSGYPRKSTTSYYASYKYVYIYFDTSAYIRRLSNTGGHTKQAYAICNYDLNSNATTTAAVTTATMAPTKSATP